MTLEEAQAKIIELTDEVNDLKTQNDSLSQNNETLTADNENLRTLNQKYFNRLIAQDTRDNNKEDEETDDVPTCEEFAKTIKL